MLGGISIIASIIGTQLVRVRGDGGIMRALYTGVFVDGRRSRRVAFIPAIYWLGRRRCRCDAADVIGWGHLYFCALVGLVITALLVAITEYYTGTRWGPVQGHRARPRRRATRRTSSAASRPRWRRRRRRCIVIGVGILVANKLAGIDGVALAVVAMLSMAGMIVALDAFGPITDNAGGIAEMADLPERCAASPTRSTPSATPRRPSPRATRSARPAWPRSCCSPRSATSSSASSRTPASRHVIDRPTYFSIDNAWVLTGLLIGGLMPFLFASMAMKAVGRAGGAVVEEVRRQFREIPGIMEGTARPEYGTLRRHRDHARPCARCASRRSSRSSSRSSSG